MLHLDNVATYGWFEEIWSISMLNARHVSFSVLYQSCSHDLNMQILCSGARRHNDFGPLMSFSTLTPSALRID